MRLIDFVNNSYKKEKNSYNISFTEIESIFEHHSETVHTNNDNSSNNGNDGSDIMSDECDFEDDYGDTSFSRVDNDFDSNVQIINITPFAKYYKSQVNIIRTFTNNKFECKLFLPFQRFN